MASNQLSLPSGSGTFDNNAMMALFQQVLQKQAQLIANLATKRQLPLVDKIKRQEDFPAWRNKVVRVLQRHDLSKYILTDVPRPEHPAALKQWLDDRADVDDYLQAAVADLKVWTILEGMGWKAVDLDPKKTFDKITQYFEGGSVDGLVTMLQEFALIRRESFASMEAYQSRINYLKNRLQTDGSAFKMPDDGYTWMALKGVTQEYPDLYNRCVIAINNNHLSWSDLMAEFRRVALTEKAQPGLTNVKINKSPKIDDKKDNNKSNNRKDRDGKPCIVCLRPLYRGYQHCKACGHHIPENKDCWWCEPEKAPDTWAHKAKAIRRKLNVRGKAHGYHLIWSEHCHREDSCHVAKPRLIPGVI
ncbi:hypothetical protein VTI74DRAFT_11598 [Chaetomium olivicolor]